MNTELKKNILNNPLNFFNIDELSILHKNISSIIKKNNNSRIYVFTDGSSINNGKKNSYGGYAIFFGHNNPKNKSVRINNNVTNNQMELLAIYECLKLLDDDKKYIIVSDSEYSIKCVTAWYKNWIKNNWMTSYNKPVKNKNLIIKIIQLLKVKDVIFFHVNSHKPEPDNKNSLEYKLWYGNKLVDNMTKNN